MTCINECPPTKKTFAKNTLNTTNAASIQKRSAPHESRYMDRRRCEGGAAPAYGNRCGRLSPASARIHCAGHINPAAFREAFFQPHNYPRKTTSWKQGVGGTELENETKDDAFGWEVMDWRSEVGLPLTGQYEDWKV